MVWVRKTHAPLLPTLAAAGLVGVGGEQRAARLVRDEQDTGAAMRASAAWWDGHREPWDPRTWRRTHCGANVPTPRLGTGGVDGGMAEQRGHGDTSAVGSTQIA